MRFRVSRGVLALLLVSVSLVPATSVVAQSVTLSGVTPNQKVRDTKEYFTDELGEPRDFVETNTCDNGINYYQYTSYSHDGKSFTGTHGLRDHSFDNVLPIPTTGTVVDGIWRDCAAHAGLNGQPINAVTYDRVATKFKNSTPSSWVLYWSKSRDYAVQGYADFDGYFPPNGTPGVGTPVNGWALKNIDLASAVAPRLTDGTFKWDGLVTGVSLWTSAFQTKGGTSTYDYLRFINSADSPHVSLSFSSAGFSGQHYVDLFVDDDATGNDGYELRRSLPTTGSYDLLTGILEPGRNYYFYAELVQYSGATRIVSARSAYIGPIYVNGKSTLKFTSPSRTSGQDYATAELNNPWDMDPTDVLNLGTPNALLNGIQQFRYENGHLLALSMNDPTPISVDPHFILNFATNKPILSSLYRYFCFKMLLNSAAVPRNGDLAELYKAGRVIRATWFDDTNVEQTIDFDAVEKTTSFNFPDESAEVTYCVDLWNVPLFRGNGWRSKPTWKGMRLDPHESFSPEWISLDGAGLYAENRADSNGNFTVTWKLDDPEGDTSTVQLYYDTDRTGFDGVLFDSVVTGPGAGARIWNTANVPRGSYYIYAVITDSFGNVTRYYSDVDVKVKETEPRLGRRTEGDFDGDGKADIAVLRWNHVPDRADLYVRNSSTGQTSVYPNGTSFTLATGDGDFDGDLKTDLGYFHPETGRWFNTLSSENHGIAHITQWGERVDVPVPMDVNGNGKSDYTVFRSTTGHWWTQLDSGEQSLLTWGQIFDDPVRGRYNDDATYDFAVFRGHGGDGSMLARWLIHFGDPNLGHVDMEFGLTRSYLAQFGGRDYPLAGDTDGTGKDSPIIVRYINGQVMAYLCQNRVGNVCSNIKEIALGATPGAPQPTAKDYDGDGFVDIAVFEPTGNWLWGLSSQGYAPQRFNYGLPGDRAALVADGVKLDVLGPMNHCILFGLLDSVCRNAFAALPDLPPAPPKKKRRR